MKKQLLFIITFFLFGNLIAQNFQWAKAITGTAKSTALDATGNLYTIGVFIGTVDFDPSASTFTLASSGSNDVFVSKFDSNGNFIWAKKWGGTGDDRGYSICLDASNNIYVAGYFNNTVDFDPNATTYTISTTTAGFSDIFISKLDGSGNLVWAKKMGGTSSDGAVSVAVNSTGDVYTTGFFTATSDFDPSVSNYTLTSNGSGDIFVSKLNSLGNFVWAKSFGGSLGDGGYSISIDNSNNVLITGSFQGTTDFDPSISTYTLTSNGGQDIFILKLDLNGNFVWSKKIGGIGDDHGESLILDASDNIYTTGYFNDVVDFDPNAGVYSISGGIYSNVFISKIDATGSFVWAKNFGGTGNAEGISIKLDASNNVYTVGEFIGTTDFDPNGGTNNLSSNGPYWDIFISKLDVNGDFVWVNKISSNGQDDMSKSISVDNGVNVYVTGALDGTADMDPSNNVYNLNSSPSFILKLGACPSPAGNINGLNSVCIGSTINYYINSVSGATNYSWSVNGGGNIISGQNTPSISITFTSPTTTNIIVTPSNTCGTSSSSSLAVNVNTIIPNVNYSISPSNTVCNGTAITLYGTGASTYTWNNGISNGISFTPNNGSTYTVVGTATNNCSNSATVSITVNSTPTITAISNSSLICTGQTATLTANGANSYTWNTGNSNSNEVVTPSVTTTYTVSGTDLNGCSNYAVITQSVSMCTNINEENYLTDNSAIYPNPFNNKIYILSNGSEEEALQIFNTYGSLIYNTIIDKEKIEIDLSNQVPGIYFIKTGSITRKIIKE